MIKVLLIEDSADDILKIKQALLNPDLIPYLDSYEFTIAASLNAGLEKLKNEKIDVILLDLGLPDTRDFDGLDQIKKENSLVPVIVLTRQREETLIALEAVKRGAQDYFSKSELNDISSLDRVIRYAIERKKNIEEIILAREEALRASRAKSEFLSNMSHDIRTPLNCIIGISDLLSRVQLPADEANHVQMLNKASCTLLDLINDILDLSKIESGQAKITPTDFDLLGEIETTLDIVASRAHSKGLEMIFHIDPDVPRYLVGDPEHLNQILLNFLTNAIKFTDKGEVKLTIKKADDENLRLQFNIQDTGIGIPEDKLSMIFESFTQVAQQDLKLKRQGSGLGLAICKRLIEMMSGSLNVKSKLGQGSVFQFELPFEISNSLFFSAPPEIDLQENEILIVDDNHAHSLSLKETLTHWGAKVFTAQNAVSAIELCQQRKTSPFAKNFDFAFLDLRMPGIASGGLELAREIKDHVDSTIVMFPMNYRYGDLERLKKENSYRHLFKPVKPRNLSELLLRLKNNEAEEPISLPAATESPEHSHLKLLVADDSLENRQLIEAYFINTGYTVDIVEDGQQALEKFKTSEFDMVLMDLQMPNMNGYEALSAIRQWEKAVNRIPVPIVALTAFAMREEAVKCLSAGFKAHVTKPIRRGELLEAIKKHSA